MGYLVESKFSKLSKFRRVALVGCVVLLTLVVSGLVAEDAPPTPTPAQSVPMRGVRLSNVTGKVKLLQASQLITDTAIANTTLYEGTQVAADADGRAEIQLEDGSLLRLTPSSTLTLNVLRQEGTATDTQIELNSGQAYFELQPTADDRKLQVRFGDAVVTASSVAVLRINLDKAPGELAVLSGDALLVRSSGAPVEVHGGESLELSATDVSQSNLQEQIVPDSWDAWNTDRDQDLKAQAAQRTPATSEVANGSDPAWSDLDANGSWYDVPDEGQVWSPNEAASSGWDPYGSGDWMWTPQFGYGWISAEPWGYLPYRCGLWNFYTDFGWGWLPGIGGCNPWFGSGFWIINIGSRPPRYHLPSRPPIRSGWRPGTDKGHMGAAPIIAVNRNRVGNGVVIREGNGPVTIGGRTVQPLRPIELQPRNGGTATTGATGQRGSEGPRVGNAGTGEAKGGNTSSSGHSGVRPGYTRQDTYQDATRPGYTGQDSTRSGYPHSGNFQPGNPPSGNSQPARNAPSPIINRPPSTQRPASNGPPPNSGGRPSGGFAPASPFSGGGSQHFSGGGFSGGGGMPSGATRH